MSRTQFAILSTIAVFMTLALLSTGASSPTGGDYWVFVSAYVLVGFMALAGRAWVAAAACFTVAGVRTLIALKIGGVPFELMSSLFASLLFLMVLQQIGQRRTSMELSRLAEKGIVERRLP